MHRILHTTLIFAVALLFSAAPLRAQDAGSDAKDKAAQTEANKGSDTKEADAQADKADAQAAPAKDATAAKESKPADATAAAAAKPEAPATLRPKAKISTTLGDIVVELDAEKAPISTLNFVQYAKDGYYNGTIFHRVIKDFMIQGGGYAVDMEEKQEGKRPGIKNEWKNGLKNVRGTLAMARLGGNPDSATAQFFVNVVDNGFLDKPQQDGAAYAVFGKVVEGMEVVDEIRNTPVEKHPKYPSPDAVTPKVPVVIKSVTLLSAFDEAGVKAKLQEAEAKAKAEKENELKDVIAKIEKETGNPVTTTASGLMVSVIKEGTGASPKPTDTVKVHYRGTLLDGTEFDSSYSRGEPIEFPLNGVIKGWTEGVGMMKPGGSSYLIIPPDLGYGRRAVGPIPPNATLVFKVELLEIK